MFKSKHAGWTWEMRRTPFGGGGGFNPISAITDPISKAIGTDGSHGGLLGELAKVDPGPAIGKNLAELDKTVNKSIPGGWVTVGALAAGGTGLYFAPEIMAAMGAEAGAAGAIGTEAGQAAFFESLAAGATSTEAAAAGLAAEQTALAAGGAIANGASQFSPEVIAAANASSDPIAYIASMEGLTPAEMTAYGTVAKESGLSAADAYKYYSRTKQVMNLLDPNSAGSRVGGSGSSQFGQMTAPVMQSLSPYANMNRNSFGFDPSMTVADMDKMQKPNEESDNFGLANILKMYNKVGDPNNYG